MVATLERSGPPLCRNAPGERFVAARGGYPGPMDDRTDPTTAADTSVLSVLDVFAEHGFTANHTAEPDGTVRCGSCDTVTAAGDWAVDARHRAEGASDPADMQVVFGLRCPACDAAGALLVGYGPAASDLDQDVLLALPDDDDRVVDPLAASTD